MSVKSSDCDWQYQAKLPLFQDCNSRCSDLNTFSTLLHSSFSLVDLWCNYVLSRSIVEISTLLFLGTGFLLILTNIFQLHSPKCGLFVTGYLFLVFVLKCTYRVHSNKAVSNISYFIRFCAKSENSVMSGSVP